MRSIQWTVAVAALMVVHAHVEAADALSAQVTLSDLSYSLSSLDGSSTPEASFALAYYAFDGSTTLSEGGGVIQGFQSMGNGVYLTNQYEVAPTGSPFPSSEASASTTDGYSNMQVSVAPTQVQTSYTVDASNLTAVYGQAANDYGYGGISFVSMAPFVPQEISPTPQANTWQVTLSAHSSLTLSGTATASFVMDEPALQASLASLGSGISLDALAASMYGYAGLYSIDPTTGAMDESRLDGQANLGFLDGSGMDTTQALSVVLNNDSDASKTFLVGYGAFAGGYVWLVPGTVVPEPGTWALMGLGLGLLGWQARRQRRAV